MRLNTLYHKDYSGGLNDTSSDREIARNEASLLRNWDITYQGQLVKRSGLLLTGNSIGSSAIVGLHGYLRTTGAKDLLAVSGTTLYYLNSSTWTSLDSGFTTGLPMCFETCPINNKVYLANGTEYLHSWDRAATTLNSCLTDLGTTIPNGKILKWHKNHMFNIGNPSVSGTAYPNRLYWSAMADPDTWDTTNDFINLPGSDAGVTLGDLGDSLVIFKEHSILFLNGWGDTDWRITASASNTAGVDESVGCIAPFGVTRVGNELWFMDDEGQIRRLYQTDFDAFRKDIISTKIQGTLSGMNKAQIAKVRAWTFNDKVYFAIPTGSSTVNDTVLVFDLIASKRTGGEAWTTYTGWSVGCVSDYPTTATIDLYLGDNSTGKVYKHTGDDDNGVAIDSRWDGKLDNLDKPEIRKTFVFGYITGESGSADVDVPIYASVDNAAYGNVGTLNLMGSGSRLGPTGTFLLGPTGNATLGGNAESEEKFYFLNGGGSTSGKAVKMSIRHATLDQSAVVNSYSIHFKQRVLR